MHWGGKEIFATVFPGEWEVSIDETPVTVKSKLLAEDVKLYYAGREIHVDRIECSKLSLAVYFTAASGFRENIFDIIYGIASKALLNFGSENRKCPAGKGKSLKVNFQTIDWMPKEGCLHTLL